MTTLNYRSGISVTPAVGGFHEEYFYHDPLADDAKVVYIKEDTAIAMGHNARNRRQTNVSSPSYKIIGINGEDAAPDSGDEGVIRFFVDEDLNLNLGNGLRGRWCAEQCV